MSFVNDTTRIVRITAKLLARSARDWMSPLPAPIAQPQATIPLPTTTVKLIPGVGSNHPPPAPMTYVRTEGSCRSVYHSQHGFVVGLR